MTLCLYTYYNIYVVMDSSNSNKKSRTFKNKDSRTNQEIKYIRVVENNHKDMSKKVELENDSLSIDERMTLTKLNNLIDNEVEQYCKNNNMTLEQYNNKIHYTNKVKELKNILLEFYSSSIFTIDSNVKTNIDNDLSYVIKFNDNVVIHQLVLSQLLEVFKLQSITFDRVTNKLIVVLYESSLF